MLQHAWALADLTAVDRARTPWLFVVSHAPFYTSNLAHQTEAAAFFKIWEHPVFQRYGVDAVFSGHIHAYERTAAAIAWTPPARPTSRSATAGRQRASTRTLTPGGPATPGRSSATRPGASACLDEGFWSLSPSNIFYIENPYMYNKFQ